MHADRRERQEEHGLPERNGSQGCGKVHGRVDCRGRRRDRGARQGSWTGLRCGMGGRQGAPRMRYIYARPEEAPWPYDPARRRAEHSHDAAWLSQAKRRCLPRMLQADAQAGLLAPRMPAACTSAAGARPGSGRRPIGPGRPRPQRRQSAQARPLSSGAVTSASVCASCRPASGHPRGGGREARMRAPT